MGFCPNITARFVIVGNDIGYNIMHGPEIRTQLVDFDTLESTGSSEQCSELFHHVVSLFALTSETCSVEQLGVYDMVLARLAGMVEADVRREISAKLATLRRIPVTTVQKLARDRIDVAEPILAGSVALSDNDLVELISSVGGAHASAIAGRDVLSDVVTDVLIDLNDFGIFEKIVANHNARISSTGFEKLVAVSPGREDLQLALSKRGDIPERIKSELIVLATENVRLMLIHSDHAAQINAHKAAVAVANNEKPNEYWLSRYDFESAWQQVSEIWRFGQVDETLLRQFASQDRFAEAAAAFSILVGMSYEQSKHWLVRSDATPFLMAARALSFNDNTVKSMLTMGPWRHRFTVEDRARAFAHFQKISFDEARQRIECWLGSSRKAA